MRITNYACSLRKLGPAKSNSSFEIIDAGENSLFASVFLLYGFKASLLAMKVESVKIISLLVKVICESNGEPKKSICADGTMRSTTLTMKGWKGFYCVIQTENKERFSLGCFGFEPPSIEAVQKMFAGKPQHFREI